MAANNQQQSPSLDEVLVDDEYSPTTSSSPNACLVNVWNDGNTLYADLRNKWLRSVLCTSGVTRNCQTTLFLVSPQTNEVLFIIPGKFCVDGTVKKLDPLAAELLLGKLLDHKTIRSNWCLFKPTHNINLPATVTPLRIRKRFKRKLMKSDRFFLVRDGQYDVVRCNGRPFQFSDKRSEVQIKKWVAVPIDTDTAGRLSDEYIGALATLPFGDSRVEVCGIYSGKLMKTLRDDTTTVCCLIAPLTSRFLQGTLRRMIVMPSGINGRSAAEVESKEDILESLRHLFDSGLGSSESS